MKEKRSRRSAPATPRSRSRKRTGSGGRRTARPSARGRGDLLTAEYRDELVYFCQDGPFRGLNEQKAREEHWWALIAQPGVTMCWPIVQFWSEFVHFEWKCEDNATNETIAKGMVCWVRRGHKGGCYFKSEQLTFYRDVFAAPELLTLIRTASAGT
jgi:hypothetical protein